MYYSKENNPSRGQGYRDRIRCEALESDGYHVETLDNKHDELLAKEGKLNDLYFSFDDLFHNVTLVYLVGRHCRANFADYKRMHKCMKTIWNLDEQQPRYDVIILDYFFSPVGWVNTRWTEKFFTQTLPFFLEKNVLKPTGAIWIPNNSYVGEMIMKHYDVLFQHYAWSIIKDPELNPLYSSTENVTEQLLLCPDNITNATQIRHIESSPGGPFICFLPRKDQEISGIPRNNLDSSNSSNNNSNNNKNKKNKSNKRKINEQIEGEEQEEEQEEGEGEQTLQRDRKKSSSSPSSSSSSSSVDGHESQIVEVISSSESEE